jgi:hypothetical protein
MTGRGLRRASRCEAGHLPLGDDHGDSARWEPEQPEDTRLSAVMLRRDADGGSAPVWSRRRVETNIEPVVRQHVGGMRQSRACLQRCRLLDPWRPAPIRRQLMNEYDGTAAKLGGRIG